VDEADLSVGWHHRRRTP